jgi:hypothetical protein
VKKSDIKSVKKSYNKSVKKSDNKSVKKSDNKSVKKPDSKAGSLTMREIENYREACLRNFKEETHKVNQKIEL